MKSQHLWAVLVLLGATASLNAGCSAQARMNAGEPSSPTSSGTTRSAPAPTSGSDEKTGVATQAVTSSPGSATSPSSASAPSSTTSTSPAPSTSAEPTKAEPAKKDAPGHSNVPGVGNQRKAEGTQPGTVGKGLTKDEAKKTDDKKVDDKKPEKK